MQVAELWKPPTKLSVSEWSDSYRRLSPEASAEAGRWYTSRTEYLRGIMDAVSDPTINQIIIQSASQIGKTELILNLIGFHIHQDPAPILVVQPTLTMAQAFSKDRLAPMLRDTPVLKGSVKDPRSRDSNNTTLHKVFSGGHVSIVGANSASGLASRPVRIVLCDEIDRYPSSAGTEGDPVRLAVKRASTFWNSKVVTVSTPTIKNASRIESDYLNSDQRKYWVPCPDCKEEQTLEWQNVHWSNNDPASAVYVCNHCGSAWSEAKRLKAISKGVWRASKEFNGNAGFLLSGIYSPWISLENAVEEFLEAKKLPETLRVFINTYLGETWEEQGEGVEEHSLMERREDYDANLLDDKVILLTAGVDTQGDRLEVEVVGWGRDEESWSIDYQTLYGDPTSPQVWEELDSYLKQTFKHPKGIDLPIRCTCIDSGGHHTSQVYNFVRPREGRRIFAIKGVGGEGRALIGRPQKNNIGKIKLFSVGVDTAKELIYSRLQIKNPGAGYCHFPMRYDDEYFKQLTAEQIVTRFSKGFKKREWKKIRPRNEALDCRVYALSAFALLNLNINQLARRFETPSQKQEQEQKQPITKKFQKPRQSFVNSWR